MKGIAMSTLKIGDVLHGFEVIGFDKYRQRYVFRCLKCGKTLKKTKSQILSMVCDGCKIIDKTKKVYESLKNKIYKDYKCIGYDIKQTGNNRTTGFLIFECTNCGKTVTISAGRYKPCLAYCSCIEHTNCRQHEEIGDFIIKSMNKTISNSRNIKYEATCKHCGHTIHGQHSHIVKAAKEGCKHHVYIDGKYMKVSECRKLYLKERKKTTEKVYKRISNRAETALDKIYNDFKLYEKIHDRLDNELFHLNNDPKTKKKYEDVIKNMAKTLLRWCE